MWFSMLAVLERTLFMNKTDIKKMWIADQGDGTYKKPSSTPITLTLTLSGWERIFS